MKKTDASSKKRFCIFAQRRTGSNFLVSLLGSHNDINCYGEIFRNHFDVTKKLPFINDIYIESDYRINNPGSFLSEIEKRSPQPFEAWGFKLMKNQIGNNLSVLLKENFSNFFIIKRDNFLAQYSSEEIAKITGQGVAGRFATVKSAKVIFNEKKYVQFETRVKREYSEIKSVLSNFTVPTLEIEYKELQSSRISTNLCEFLGLSPQELVSFHKKRNTSNILDRFENIDVVREFLDANNCTDFAKE
jgi:hypothetical protein